MDSQSGSDQAAALIRRYRHLVVNHLQVISGWLQLDRPERARKYLEGVSDRMMAEADAVRHLPGDLVLQLLAMSLEAESLGIAVEWRVTGSVRGQTPAAEALQVEIDRTLSALAALPEAQRHLLVMVGPSGIALHAAGSGNQTG